MQSLELTAKSLDEAKQTAAQKLGVELNQVQITVLEETKGLFGKMNYRVRAEVADAAPAAEAKPAKKSTAKSKAKAEPAPEPEPEPVAQAEAKPAKKSAPKGKAKAEPAPAPVVAEASDSDEEEDNQEEVVATEEDANRLTAMVNEILELAQLDAEVTQTDLNGRYVNVQLDGKDVAFLVGKHGEVLNNFQYLVNVMANRKYGNGVRVTLDGNHYRDRRETALTELATQIAEQVRLRGEEAVLDALPAFERRVVHRALAEMEGISTYSEGEEPNRRIVIAPA